jgi:hypothetical protein
VKIPDAPGLGFTPRYDAFKDSLVKSPSDLKAGGVATRGKIETGESEVAKL